MKGGDLQRPNSLLCFLACHVILMVHTDLQDGGQSVVLRIARLFSRFIENQTTVYSRFDKKTFTEPYSVSTVPFMAAVRVGEPKVSEFSRCLCLRMMHTEDGVTSGWES